MDDRPYRSDFPQHYVIHAVDGMLLAFHRPSGTTLFLDSPVPEMLELLGERPMDADALTMALCERLAMPVDDEARTVIATRMTELAGSGLIHAA